MPTSSRVIGIYPGSFDPVTEGHIDMIQRAARVVDHLVVAVSRNEHKSPMFSVAERKEMLCESLEGLRATGTVGQARAIVEKIPLVFAAVSADINRAFA